MNYKLLLKKYWIGIIISIISFIVYLLRLAPTISVEDSGEFATVAYTLGIAHPTGYPLWTIIGKLFTFIPIGSIAYRVNLMSATFAALTIFILYIIAFKITKSYTASIISSVAFAFSVTFLSLAVMAEVYTLHTFFVATLILLILTWSEKRESKYIYALSFIYGLSFTNHTSVILLAIPFIYFIIKTDRRILNLRNLSIMTILFLIALTPYAYLPLRSSQDPNMDWGNPENLDNFIDHVTAKQYQYRLNPLSIGNSLEKLHDSTGSFPQQFGIPLFLIGMLGAIIYFLKDQKNLAFFILIIIINIIFGVIYTVPNTSEYYLISFMVFSILIGIGSLFIFEKIKKIKSIGKILSIILIAGIISIPFISIIQNKESDLHNFYLQYECSKELLENIEPNAIIIVRFDSENGNLRYLQEVEGLRKDVVIFTVPLIGGRWYTKEFNEKNPSINYDISARKDNALDFKLEKIKITDTEIDRVVYLNKDNPLDYNEFERCINYERKEIKH